MKNPTLLPCAVCAALCLIGSRAAAEHAPIPASRFISEASFAHNMERLSASLAIDARVRDPFGQMQDPQRGCEPAPEEGGVAPLGDLIKRMEITAIDSATGSFMIPGRTLRKGDAFTVRHHGLIRTIQAVAVGAGRVDFVDLRSGEKASWSLPNLPTGVEQQSAGSRQPSGAVDPKSAAVINLDAAQDVGR